MKPNPSRLTIPLPELHAAQAKVERSAKRFTVLCAGRRWGKDVLMSRRLIRRMSPGQSQGWFAPSYRMMAENYKDIYNRLGQVVLRASASEHRIETIGGAVIEFWSLDNYNAARGRSYAHVTINEAAAAANLLDAWNFVIRPTLADTKGGADFGSTPKGLNGFYSLWSQAADSNEWARFHFRTHDNPYIPASEIEAMRVSLPERVYRQEILAEFIEDGSYFQNIDACATVQQPDTPDKHAGHYLVMGVDWAMSEDFTVLTVGCRDCAKIVDWTRFNRLDFTYQRERLYSLADKWQVSSCLPERNSIGLPNIEIIRERIPIMAGPDDGSGYQTTATSKPPLIQSLANAIERKEIALPAEYADELRAYQVELTASNNQRFGAPAGQHDDRVISLSLCWYAMTRSRLQIFM